MLVHSGERPYKCSVCGQTFTTNGNMHRSANTHVHTCKHTHAHTLVELVEVGADLT